ncbi:MAG: hypothetical protein H0V17_09575 [Deltaproteobacteria bacterium]|nr:hypothetical protein [Deltaproteobacteria bacterium]
MQKSLKTIENTTELATKTEERGAIGAAILVWLLGGGLGLVVLVFILAKIF